MRKRMLAALVALLAGFQVMNAIPARPGRFTAIQPDGTRLTLERHGDEWGHWFTDASGRMFQQDEDGFYRVISDSEATAIREHASARRIARRSTQGRRAMARSGQNAVLGRRHFLVILVEFNNLSFKEANDSLAFTNLMNQVGYSANGGTGSARDFYYDNSHGRFEPIFDVYGPVKLTKDYSYYGKNDSWGNDQHAEEAVAEGCIALDDEIDFSLYDNDGDGKVDLVFMYYAGRGEADGGGSNTIWPHQWELTSAGINLALDGVTVDSYACSSELAGYSGTFTGVGTACHEFGHAMGLPDFYDTDYETNGEAGALYSYSTMCGGAYNNDGRTPPYFNFEERMLLGWVDESDYLTFDRTGDYTILPIDGDVAYRTFTDMDGEYFVYENRTKTGWDLYLPGEGMIVYHVDKSTRKVSGSTTAKALWDNWHDTNSINAKGSHPCFYIVPAASQSSLNYYYESRMPFPYGDVNTYVPNSWNGVDGPVSFSRISFANGQVSLYAKVNTGDLDYPTIADPGNYTAGSRFTFALTQSETVAAPASVVWYFDDEPAGADSVTLTAGAHIIEAVLTYANGRRSVLSLEINVQ